MFVRIAPRAHFIASLLACLVCQGPGRRTAYNAWAKLRDFQPMKRTGVPNPRKTSGAWHELQSKSFVTMLLAFNAPTARWRDAGQGRGKRVRAPVTIAPRRLTGSLSIVGDLLSGKLHPQSSARITAVFMCANESVGVDLKAADKFTGANGTVDEAGKNEAGKDEAAINATQLVPWREVLDFEQLGSALRAEMKDLQDFEKVAETLHRDIPKMLRKEPDWSIFAADFKIINQTEAGFQGIGFAKLLLELLRRVRKKHAVKDEVRVQFIVDKEVEQTSDVKGPRKISNQLLVRWKVRLNFGKSPLSSSKVDIEADTRLHLNENNRIDYVVVESWDVNGVRNYPLPDVILTDKPRKNLRKIRQWAQEIKRERKQIRKSGKLLKGGFGGSVYRLVTAMRRIVALAFVDVSLSSPGMAGICKAAVEALRLGTSTGEEFVYYRKSKAPSALLILAHPSEEPSLCRTLANIWEDSLRKEGIQTTRVDLAPAQNLGLRNFTELQASLRGREGSPAEVGELQRLVEDSQFLVFVHPVFWFEVPSQLKGFLESVLSSGFAFRNLPNHWVLNTAAGILKRLPIIRRCVRRYLAYGLLRDKRVYVTRTHGGAAAGMGIFGHQATSLESSVQFCGAHLSAVDVYAEIHSKTRDSIKAKVLPKAEKKIKDRCRNIAAQAKALSLSSRRGKL